MITALVVLLVAGSFFGLGYVAGVRETMAANTWVQNAMVTSDHWKPLPEGFQPRRDGGKELDDPVHLVQVEPTYYEYENGEATGEVREEFRS